MVAGRKGFAYNMRWRESPNIRLVFQDFNIVNMENK